MSVYTVVEPAQLSAHLLHYNVGELVSFEGISSGIENTNYFVSTTQGEFVLTLFEEIDAEELPYFLDIMVFVSKLNIPSTQPIADKTGEYIKILRQKPSALVERIAGSDINHPTAKQCQAIAHALATFHHHSPQLKLHRENSRGATWRKETAQRLIPLVDAETAELIKSEMLFQNTYTNLSLESGVIHGDLFKDNALFDGENLSGIIDFYYACNDYYLYDVAVAVNDWCVQEDGLLNTDLFNAFMAAYQAIRPLSTDEITHWPLIIRAAAFRFWLSRLRDVHFPKAGEITHLKDPDAMKNILIARRDKPENYSL